MTPEQRIICSAIHFQDGNKYCQQPCNISSGFVIAGRRHSNCFETLTILSKTIEYSKLNPINGFLTSDDMFVERSEAFDIAEKANQLSFVGKERTLLSEDLY